MSLSDHSITCPMKFFQNGIHAFASTVPLAPISIPGFPTGCKDYKLRPISKSRQTATKCGRHLPSGKTNIPLETPILRNSKTHNSTDRETYDCISNSGIGIISQSAVRRLDYHIILMISSDLVPRPATFHFSFNFRT